jgi:anaerobic magnesium-protoporphyrin IX monomethyl ester cyclase
VHSVKGIAFKENGKFTRTQNRELIDLEKLPPLPYYLSTKNIFDYKCTNKYGLFVETSRGCPFKCNFCYNSVFNRGVWRQKSAGKVVADIIFYSEKYKINHFNIIDDNFFADLNRAKEVMSKLVSINKNMILEFSGVRADSICQMDDEFFRLFKQLNDGTMRVGIETGSQKILDLINKNVTLEKYRQANKILARHQIRSYYNFMIGFPFETKADLKETIRFGMELMAENPYARIDFMAIYQPYPGTILFEECVRQGYFTKPERLADWSLINMDKASLSCFSENHKKLLEKITRSSFGLMIRKKSKLRELPIYLRPVARTWSFIQKLRMKYFFFAFFGVENFFYDYAEKAYFKKDYLIE